MKQRRCSSREAGFGLIDTIAGASLAIFITGMVVGVQLSITKGIGAIQAESRFRMTLTLAADQLVRDIESARSARNLSQSWNGFTPALDSNTGGAATWILNLLDNQHIVYQFQTPGEQAGQLIRNQYGPNYSTTRISSRVVANALDRVAFEECVAGAGIDRYTQCVDARLRHAPDTGVSTAENSILREQRARAVYRNS